MFILNEFALKAFIKINHYFTKDFYDENFVKNAESVEETENEFIITVKTLGMKLVSKYKKSDLTKEQIEFIKSDHKKPLHNTTILI